MYNDVLITLQVYVTNIEKLWPIYVPLENATISRAIRIYQQSYTNHPAIRLELVGRPYGTHPFVLDRCYNTVTY